MIEAIYLRPRNGKTKKKFVRQRRKERNHAEFREMNQEREKRKRKTAGAKENQEGKKDKKKRERERGKKTKINKEIGGRLEDMATEICL